MKLTVDTFLAPSKDPELKKIDEWRSANKYPAVDYHRVTADNSAGQVADRGRTLRFAAAPERIPTGEVVEARFSCDALAFEWVPPVEDKTQQWNDLRARGVRGRPAEAGRHRARAPSRSTTWSPTAASPSAGSGACGCSARATPSSSRPAEPRRSGDRRGSAGLTESWSTA